MSKTLEFWLEFASPYAYLSAMRIEDEAKKRGVKTIWRPFLLGPIYGRQGMTESPYTTYPKRAAYMWRDMERWANAYGLEFNRPGTSGKWVHQESLYAARMALVALKEDWGREFCRRIFNIQWVTGGDIADQGVLNQTMLSVGGTEQHTEEAKRIKTKALLRVNTDQADQIGVFGAPTFVVDGDLFYGHERLEDALDFAAAGGRENLDRLAS